MLDSTQLKDLDAAEREINNMETVLNTAIDIQALLRILVDKEIITKREIDKMRKEVRESPKYANALTYVSQTRNEILKYKNDPQELLRRMFNDKLKGNQ